MNKVEIPGCCEVSVGRAQLRGGSGGRRVGGVHPLHWALEWAHRPLVPRNAGLPVMRSSQLNLVAGNTNQCFICEQLNDLVTRFFQMCWQLFPGWSTSSLTPAGLKRLSGSTSASLLLSELTHWLKWSLGLDQHYCDWALCRTLGKVRTSGVERGTLSAFEDFLCALVKVSASDRIGDTNSSSKSKCFREARTWMRC